MKFVWLISWLTVRIAISQATSHWMVTETGLIQPRNDSPFLMENPFDLLSFLNQDTRWENIFTLYHNLIHRQKNINRIWIKLEYDSNFDKHIVSNELCENVGNIHILIDWYASFLEDGTSKGIPEKDFLIKTFQHGDTEVPDCKKISSLTFSMFAFEHLDGMVNREHLNGTPEFELPDQFSPIMTVDQYGHWLSDTLRKNSYSWLHYNLASIYWRAKGNMPKAMECSRRAVHYAPRQYKDVALLCLGAILHRSKHSDDAAVVLGAAVDHDPGFAISHFALGGALAVIGDFNSSLKHYDLSIKLHTKFDMAKKFRNGVLCHMDMLKKMQIAQGTLEELKRALQEYVDTEQEWLKFQTSFVKTMQHKGEYDYKNISQYIEKMDELSGLQIKELKKEGDRNSLAQYFINSPSYNVEWNKVTGVAALDEAQSLHGIIRQIGTHAGLPTEKTLFSDNSRNITDILKEIGPAPSFPDILHDRNHDGYTPFIDIRTELKDGYQKSVDSEPATPEIRTCKTADTGKLLYPSDMIVNRNKEIFDTEPDFPSKKFCTDEHSTFPREIETVYPVFMPFGNKGIILDYLLTERIGVPALVEHDLPWHPPACPRDKEFSLHTQKRGMKVQLADEKVKNEILRKHLLEYLSDSHMDIMHMQDAEIGQRINTAIKKKSASKWVLYTIASLYWRIRGNMPNALNCLLTASRVADTRYRDVVLVSLASVLLEMGLLDESMNKVETAYEMSPYEPATNFILAQIQMVKKNYKAQLFHLTQAIRVDGLFMDGIPRNVLYGWSCLLKQLYALTDVGSTDEKNEICTEVEPGLSMVCDLYGNNCRISKQHCDSSNQQSNTAKTGKNVKKHFRVSLVTLKDETIRHVSVEDISDLLFDQYLDAMPIDRTDIVAHQKNYDAMMKKTVEKMLMGCGARGCYQFGPENVGLKLEDCTSRMLWDNWLHVISFKKQLSEIDMNRLPAEITAMSPAKKNIPDCKLTANWDKDFFLSRMMKVDTNKWVPVPSLTLQITELFNFNDFTLLGSKIAKYIENRSSSWAGLVAAGWWCGAAGRGACAARCLAAAHAAAPPRLRAHALRPLVALLTMQSKPIDAKDIAYLSFYTEPKNLIEAFIAGVSHVYVSEYEQAVWMFRYALMLDHTFLPIKVCIKVTMCLLLYGDPMTPDANKTPTNVK